MAAASDSSIGTAVLYRDERVVAIAKPAGLASVPSGLDRGLPTALRELRNALGQKVFPVHRLDRPTSGVLLFGLDPEAARDLSAALADKASKTYVAVVRGHTPDEGVIDKPLADPYDDAGPLRPAITRFRTLARTEQPWPVRPYTNARYSLVELTPQTGRTHQLRLHMRSLAHPIVGDTQHGDGAHNRAFAEHLGIKRLMLHARTLAVPGLPLLTAPFDDAWTKALALFER